MQDLLHEATDPWGVTVERVEVVIVMSHIYCHIHYVDDNVTQSVV